MGALLSGANGPSADELAERYGNRTALSAKDAPPTLGPPPPPPPDPSGLPPGAARVMRAIGWKLLQSLAKKLRAAEHTEAQR